MNNISISKTKDNTLSYPLHRHNNWEIMYYLSGEGHLATAQNGIPFKKGSIIIVPPGTVHGSVSNGGFVNISVGGDFNHLFMFDKPVKLQDSGNEGETLARLIYENRYSNNDYLSSLCTAYIHFLLQNAEYENRINRIIGELVAQITANFTRADLNITTLLKSSGYAEDYIRNEFKKATSYTPVQFLTKTRIDHAKKIFEIYGKDITVAEVAEICGFSDPIYFSKRFKQLSGFSPQNFKNQILK